jgi:hypothetical protein
MTAALSVEIDAWTADFLAFPRTGHFFRIIGL